MEKKKKKEKWRSYVESLASFTFVDRPFVTLHVALTRSAVSGGSLTLACSILRAKWG